MESIKDKWYKLKCNIDKFQKNRFEKYYITDMKKGDYYKNIDTKYKKSLDVILAIFFVLIVGTFANLLNVGSSVNSLILIVLSLLFVFLFAYRYSKIIFLLTPFIGYMMFYDLRGVLFTQLLNNIQNQTLNFILNLFVYILTTLFLYSVVIIAVPLPTLRKIKNGIMLTIIPVAIAFLMIFLSMGLSIFLRYYLQDLNEFDEYMINELAYLLRGNVDDINYIATELLYAYMQRYIMTYVNVIFGVISFLFAVGALIIKFRMDKNRKKANKLFRKLAFAPAIPNYMELVECAFYGGVEYENLILNNENTKNIVMEKEKSIEFCNFSIWYRCWQKVIAKFPLNFLLQ